MEAEGNNIINRYTHTGEEGEVIPDDATHVFVVAKAIRARAFFDHPNIVEVTCHEDVEEIEKKAFAYCRRLRRVIMPGVKIVAKGAFFQCKSLTDVECGKLEIIGDWAFRSCKSLSSINLPSARIVEGGAFTHCAALMDLKFGSKLERIEEYAFYYCKSLERITIPFKDGLISHDNIFQGCRNLKHVDLVEGELHETIATLQLEEWRNNMNEEIDAINQILPAADAGYYYDGIAEEEDIEGEKAQAIRTWIRSLLGKIIEYKSEHRRLLDEDVAPILQCILPRDIVMNNVLPFLELSSNTFEFERDNHEEDEQDSESDIE